MAEIVSIKSPPVFNEPPPKEEDFRIPEVDFEGKPVFWTMGDALEGKCDFNQIGRVRYYEKDCWVIYEYGSL